MQECTYILFDIVPLINAVNNHAFGDGNDLRRYFVERINNRSLVAAIGVLISHKRIQLIRKLKYHQNEGPFAAKSYTSRLLPQRVIALAEAVQS